MKFIDNGRPAYHPSELLAGDSTKLREQNSKKNNFNPAKIERCGTHLYRIQPAPNIQ